MAVVAVIDQMSLMGRNPDREGDSGEEAQRTRLALRGVPSDGACKRILDGCTRGVETLDDALFVLVRAQKTKLLSEVVFNDHRLCERRRLYKKKRYISFLAIGC